MPIREELEFLDGIEFSEKNKIISEQILKEIRSRLNFLIDVGLDYLNLSIFFPPTLTDKASFFNLAPLHFGQ